MQHQNTTRFRRESNAPQKLADKTLPNKLTAISFSREIAVLILSPSYCGKHIPDMRP